MSQLEKPIDYLQGIGTARAELLKKELGIFKYGDLLSFYPNRYLDRTKYYLIAELDQTLSDVQIVGKIINLKYFEQKKGKRLVATFADTTGSIELVWFRGQKTIESILKINEPYVIFGKPNVYNNQYSMVHPEMETINEHKSKLRSAMQAIYPSTEMLNKRNLTSRLISNYVQNIFAEIGGNFGESLSPIIISKLDLMPKSEAMLNIHFPKSAENLARAQFRLKFEELFFIQMQLIAKNKLRKQKIKGHAFEKVGKNFHNFYDYHLPFQLTDAQKRVIKEIRADMSKHAQMNRLLQGDVGSGKTIVALMTMLIAMDNGFQACLMAPTEILAQQHFYGLTELAQDLDVNIRLLTGSSKTAERKEIHSMLIDGTLDIIIGTHALLEDKVQFKNLGLAVIDEQHRFGVEQRSKLWTKNAIPPHVLVMTATPIPRTLAMSLYGDLDISVIDELPPGRKPIRTVHRFDSNRLSVWKFIRDEIQKGRQIYIVYPLINESETLDYKDLMDGYESISRDFPLPKYAVSVVHGQMKPVDKEIEMQRFVAGKTNIMVATTVIEVGVNVPNASVMIIESAERFGLSQLHQLRGRVGRGADQSFCILMTGHKLSPDSKMRIETMVSTTDGFEIAEVDLKLRGPGDIMGKQQSGALNLKIADLVKDREILTIAREWAINIFDEDPQLESIENLNIRKTFAAIIKKSHIWNYIS